jgi:hypothetical protein
VADVIVRLPVVALHVTAKLMVVVSPPVTLTDCGFSLDTVQLGARPES